MASNDRDRRTYFRIEDRILLQYRAVTETELRDGLWQLRRGTNPEFGLAEAMLGVDHKLRNALIGVRRGSPGVADALELLNRKLNTLIGLIPAARSAGPSLLDERLRRCDLSAAGIAFDSEAEFEPDTHLLLRMMLMPSYEYVAVFARTIRCAELPDPDGDRVHSVACTFESLPDKVRETLVRHTLSKEAGSLKLRRLQKD